MRLYANNVKRVKTDMTGAEMQEEVRQMVRKSFNSEKFDGLAIIAVQVVNYYQERGVTLTFMQAMDIVDKEAQVVLSAIKECAIC